MRDPRQPSLPSFLHRSLAAGSAVLVFALGLFAASPLLHEHLHGHAGLPAGDTCAVALFANGISAPVAFATPPPPVAEWHEARVAASIEIFLDSPRYLHRPERGPPAV
ncbi:MAG TPA: hypothetical protein VG710_09930 [Opitutus sp.]|nr:hypothetical protein [Opitutus sp.]